MRKYWKKPFTHDDVKGWHWDENILVANTIDESVIKNKDVYTSIGGVQQRNRSNAPAQAGYYDLPYYRSALERALRHLPSNPTATDLGCGDGRWINLLLDHGIGQIIAQDFNKSDLVSLWNSLNEEDKDKVILLNASVTDPPYTENYANLTILSEVAYVLPTPQEAYKHCYQWLKKGGIAIVSNVAKSAYFMHAILNEDWRQVNKIVTISKYIDTVSGKEIDVHLYTREMMDREAAAVGFDKIESITIPAGAGLLIHALRKAKKEPSEYTPLLEKAVDSTEIPRVYIDILRK